MRSLSIREAPDRGYGLTQYCCVVVGRQTRDRKIASSNRGRCIAGCNSAFHLSGVGKSSTSLLAGVEVGRVHLCRVAGNTV